jgi:transposase
MERYIGLDVHARSCTLAVVSAAGKRLGIQVVETNGAALKQAFTGIPGNLHVCLEEGTQSAWIYELIKGQAEVAVVIPEAHYGPKDDARDAWSLAESLRVGAIKRRVYKDHGPFSELRAAMRSYTMLRDDVRRTKNRLKAVYRSRGLMPPAGQPFHSEHHRAWARKLPPEQARSAELLLEQLRLEEDLWSKAEERLVSASKKHPIVKLLATAPAIGPVRSAQIVATVVTPHRFRTKRQFWAYCGLAVVMRSSANWEKDRTGKWVRANVQQSLGLNRNRNGSLKEVFKSAAHQVAIQMTSHPLHRDFVRLTEGGMKPNLAMVTIARRIAAAVLAMWKHEEVYEAKKHESKISALA